ncbi:MAG: hypothetical protein ABI605_02670 [Rhizobacter sp.]
MTSCLSAIHRFLRSLPAVTALIALAACGGSTDANVGGTVTGLTTGTSVTLENNGSSPLIVSANGSFWFANTVSSGSSYSVTVLTQPTAASCSVSNGSGTISSTGSDVSDVLVTCVSNATLVGTVAGLAAGTSLVLANGNVMLAIAANGSFAFPGVLVAGTIYNVTVGTQPSGQTCVVSNGVGTVVANTQTAMVVICS